HLPHRSRLVADVPGNRAAEKVMSTVASNFIKLFNIRLKREFPKANHFLYVVASQEGKHQVIPAAATEDTENTLATVIAAAGALIGALAVTDNIRYDILPLSKKHPKKMEDLIAMILEYYLKTTKNPEIVFATSTP